jgi:hypothetical protein
MRGVVERRRGFPTTQELHKVFVTPSAHRRVQSLRGVIPFLRKRFSDLSFHWATNVLGLQIGDQIRHSADENLSVADLTKQVGVPGQFGIQLIRRTRAEDVAKDPQCTTQPAHCDPSLVHNQGTSPQSDIVAGEYSALGRQVRSDEHPDRPGFDLGRLSIQRQRAEGPIQLRGDRTWGGICAPQQLLQPVSDPSSSQLGPVRLLSHATCAASNHHSAAPTRRGRLQSPAPAVRRNCVLGTPSEWVASVATGVSLSPASRPATALAKAGGTVLAREPLCSSVRDVPSGTFNCQPVSEPRLGVAA